NPRYYQRRGALSLTMKDSERALVDFNYLLNWYETDPNTVRPVPKNNSNPKEGKDPDTFAVLIGQETQNDAPGDKDMAPVILETYAYRAQILGQRGNHDAAISDLTKALRIQPRNFDLLYDRINEHEAKGDLAAALADVNKGLEFDPMNGN